MPCYLQHSVHIPSPQTKETGIRHTNTADTTNRKVGIGKTYRYQISFYNKPIFGYSVLWFQYSYFTTFSAVVQYFVLINERLQSPFLLPFRCIIRLRRSYIILNVVLWKFNLVAYFERWFEGYLIGAWKRV